MLGIISIQVLFTSSIQSGFLEFKIASDFGLFTLFPKKVCLLFIKLKSFLAESESKLWQ